MSSREVISFAGGVILVGAGADLVITGFVVVATFLFGNQGNEDGTLFSLVVVTGGVTVGAGFVTQSCPVIELATTGFGGLSLSTRFCVEAFTISLIRDKFLCYSNVC